MPELPSPLETLNQHSGGAPAREAELAAKHARLREWLAQSGYEGVLLRRHENLAWITAGQLDARVGTMSETAIAALLLLRDGRKFCLAPNNEAARVAAEELPGLGYQPLTSPLIQPWYSMDFAVQAQTICATGLASDTPHRDLPHATLGPLRAPLQPAEMERFRHLGRQTADSVSEVLLALEPGVTEYEMEARMAERLLRVGILPSVLLMAADDRILRYKHAVARGNRLERYGMLNLCTRRWGLAISITRFVHFGKLPPELAQGFAVAAQVNAALQHATRTGATAGSLFHTAAQAYAMAGWPGEEQLHHQGGACGYLEREWLATPGGTELVLAPQAYAWNPSSRGGKVEDTTLALEGTIEVLTFTPGLPQVLTEQAGTPYISAGVLVRT